MSKNSMRTDAKCPDQEHSLFDLAIARAVQLPLNEVLTHMRLSFRLTGLNSAYLPGLHSP